MKIILKALKMANKLTTKIAEIGINKIALLGMDVPLNGFNLHFLYDRICCHRP
jgi:hypothetical protein